MGISKVGSQALLNEFNDAVLDPSGHASTKLRIRTHGLQDLIQGPREVTRGAGALQLERQHLRQGKPRQVLQLRPGRFDPLPQTVDLLE